MKTEPGMGDPGKTTLRARNVKDQVFGGVTIGDLERRGNVRRDDDPGVAQTRGGDLAPRQVANLERHGRADLVGHGAARGHQDSLCRRIVFSLSQQIGGHPRGSCRTVGNDHHL